MTDPLSPLTKPTIPTLALGPPPAAPAARAPAELPAARDRYESRVDRAHLRPVEQSPHDQAVQAYVSKKLEQFNNNPTYRDLSVADKLNLAAASVIGDRERDPTNTVLRDADYYFAARKNVAAAETKAGKLAVGAAGTALTVGYNGLKAVLNGTGVMRTDPDKPNSPPGGLSWETKGAVDGYKDLGNAKGAMTDYRK
ncbi:MAG: hypothetical protein U1E65_22450 [Myxococcota bacterium]